MEVVWRLLASIVVILFTILFNFSIIDIRLEEIQYLLGKIATAEEIGNTFGIIGKYELIKMRRNYGEENISNYELEARMQALTSASILSKEEPSTKKFYRIPIRLLLNLIRWSLGKAIINPTEDDKIYNILEIAYIWERNRKYTEALKIYEEIIETYNTDPKIKAAILVHQAFCYSMLSMYEKAKQIYEDVINNYSETEAGIIAWKLLDFINSIEREREEAEKSNLSTMEKAKRFYHLMDFRNAIKNYSIFLSQPQSVDKEVEARFFKGRSHEEIGETEEALLEYRAVIKKDLSKKWAREANRRLLMLGEFYEQQRDIAEEAKRQLEAYQDEILIKQVETYKKMAGPLTLKDELLAKTKEKTNSESSDSIIKMIDEIGSLDLMGTKEDTFKQEEVPKKIYRDRTTLSKAEMRELKRREYLAAHPFRRPAAIKELIDENISELKYLYNKRLKAGIKISGKMIVEIHINADGSIGKTVAVHSELGDPDFENSILEQIKKWKFRPVPDSLGTLIIKYPFEFNEEM